MDRKPPRDFVEKILKLQAESPFRDRKEDSSFKIVDFDKKMISEWVKKQQKEEIERRKKWYKDNNQRPTDIEVDCWKMGYPYHGAIGGELTYQFTPTSIGLVFKVLYTAFDGVQQLDLTDYSMF